MGNLGSLPERMPGGHVGGEWEVVKGRDNRPFKIMVDARKLQEWGFSSMTVDF